MKIMKLKNNLKESIWLYECVIISIGLSTKKFSVQKSKWVYLKTLERPSIIENLTLMNGKIIIKKGSVWVGIYLHYVSEGKWTF